jgi:hypothetical protein
LGVRRVLAARAAERLRREDHRTRAPRGREYRTIAPSVGVTRGGEILGGGPTDPFHPPPSGGVDLRSSEGRAPARPQAPSCRPLPRRGGCPAWSG